MVRLIPLRAVQSPTPQAACNDRRSAQPRRQICKKSSSCEGSVLRGRGREGMRRAPRSGASLFLRGIKRRSRLRTAEHIQSIPPRTWEYEAGLCGGACLGRLLAPEMPFEAQPAQGRVRQTLRRICGVRSSRDTFAGWSVRSGHERPPTSPMLQAAICRRRLPRRRWMCWWRRTKALRHGVSVAQARVYRRRRRCPGLRRKTGGRKASQEDSSGRAWRS